MTHIRLLWVSAFLISAFAPFACACETAAKSWELVRSVKYLTGNATQYFVVIPALKQRERDYYDAIAQEVCGQRQHCMVFFWTDPANVPTSVEFNGVAMQAMTAQYERSPNYEKPHLRLACWLSSSLESAELMQCFSMPGAKIPPSNKAQTSNPSTLENNSK